MEEQEIINLIKKNLELTQENNRLMKKVNRYIVWTQVIGVIKIIIIIVPIILGLIYLPSIFGDLIEQYRDLLQG